MNDVSDTRAAVGGFFDLAKLVSASGTSKSSAYEELAYKIGACVGHNAAAKWCLSAQFIPGACALSRNLSEGELSFSGQDVYADFGGWHLYLRDMKGTPDLKMAQVVANAIGAKVRGIHPSMGCSSILTYPHDFFSTLHEYLVFQRPNHKAHSSSASTYLPASKQGWYIALRMNYCSEF